ncbi:M48 family metalloprotease [Duganella sp. FT109W]|uniref:M48 family metalloprotease n=1 Tax=Duganella margarita TaxID=2692170 RepID=A0ABW9WB63_9BURK|nr:M48 family metalloprotease [Duganella margarita]MYN38311.1 M48 family metalloprotease [Duganella margarita]
MRTACATLLLLLACTVQAQVPESGRAQELLYSAAEVDAGMEDRYIDRTVDLAAAGKLDEDRALLARLRYISAELIRVAIDLKPETAQWQWEVHTTSDTEVDAICMAGGKILVGSAFVHQLALTDGELAMLLAHEVAHAVAEHHRETFSEAMLVNRLPAVPLDVVMARLDSDLSLQIRLSKLSSLQESEADHLGMVLAHRAGWSAEDIVSFYRKLAEGESSALISSAYPANASRLSMARGMARLFGD